MGLGVAPLYDWHLYTGLVAVACVLFASVIGFGVKSQTGVVV
jgi:hypothetical protein